MRVLWTLSAEQDRADIVDFIANDNPLAAIRMDEIFSAAAGRLAEHLAALGEQHIVDAPGIHPDRNNTVAVLASSQRQPILNI